MKENNTALTVNILDRDYQVACNPGEEPALQAAATYLDQQMRDIRQRGRVIGLDRIAVMAGLNIAHKLLQLQPMASSQVTLAEKISELQQQIRETLNTL